MGRFLSILLVASAIPALADDDDWRRRRDDRNSGYGYGRNDGYYGRDDGYYGRDRGGYGNNRGGYGNRGVFASVQQNLRRAASESRGLSSREHDRYNNAFRHLSEFESRYAQGKWDNGKLDQAIEDVNNVV